MKDIYLYIFIGLLCFGNAVSIDAQSSRLTDSLALVELYDSTNGGNWANDWNLSEPLDSFYGVTLDGNGRVLKLEILNDTNLTGKLPDLNLPKLTRLALSGNKLSGNIPDFSNLPNLLQLYLHNNDSLNGSIPNFSNLPKLRQLWLSTNQLNGSIPNFSNQANLKNLWLGNNQLSGSIPTSLGNLLKLERLWLSNNQLSGNIPTSLGNLSKLERLYLGNNGLSGSIPDTLGNLSNLKRLSLKENKLNGHIPNALGNLSALESLQLQKNQLSGHIPDFSVNATNLYSIRIDSNQFTFEDIVENYIVNNTLITNNSNNSSQLYNYAPQDSVGISDTIIVNAGTSYTINLGFDDTVTTSTYTWYKDGTQIHVGTTNQYSFSSIDPSDSGVYTCQVTNSIATALTLNARPITLEVFHVIDSVINISCHGNGDGSLGAIPNRGIPPYTYLWSTNAATQFITGLNAGIYFVTVTDSKNHTLIDTMEIIEPPMLDANYTIVNHAPCFEGYGTANLNILGGTNPYTYLWDNGETTIQADSLLAGAHQVTITDANNCQVGASLIIDEPDSLKIELISIKTPICYGSVLGNIVVEGSGGSGNYSYLWSNSSIDSSLNNLSIGWYQVTMTDMSSCEKVDSFEIVELNKITITTTTISDQCNKGVGCIEIGAIGGKGFYDYYVNGQPSNDTTCNLQSGAYTVTVVDSLGCMDSLLTIINNVCDSCSLYTAIEPVGGLGYQYSCVDRDIAEVTINVEDGKPAFDQWSEYVFIVLIDGMVQDTIKDIVGVVNFEVVRDVPWTVIVTDIYNCDTLIISDTFIPNTINCSNLCDIYSINWSHSSNTSILPNSTAILEAQGDFTTIQWFEGSKELGNQKRLEVSPSTTTIYNVVVRNEEGCSDTSYIMVEVGNTLNIPEYYGMQAGDIFEIKDIHLYPKNRLVIYNVWGQSVFDTRKHTKSYDNSWTGENVPEGMYRYVFESKPNSSENKIEQGWIILF